MELGINVLTIFDIKIIIRAKQIKIMFRKLLIIIFFCFNFTIAKAQNGNDYIINNQGDTINGYVLSISSKGNFVTFKSNQGDKKRFKPDEIKYFFIYNQGLYKSFPSDSSSSQQQPFFAQQIIRSRASLYKIDEIGVAIVKKNNGKQFYISSMKDYITNFESMFNDCKELTYDIKNLGKSFHKSLENDIIKYNQYIKPDTLVWQAQSLKMNIKKGFFVGINHSRAEIIREPIYNGEYPSINYEIGAFVNFSYLRRLSFQIEGIYSPQFGNTVEDLISGLYEKKVDYYFQIFRFPLMFRYTALSGKIRPILMLGASNSVLLSQNGTYQLSSFSVPAKLPLNRFNFGYVVGAGLKILVNKNTAMNTEIRYYDNRLLSGVETRVLNPILAFVVGVEF